MLVHRFTLLFLSLSFFILKSNAYAAPAEYEAYLESDVYGHSETSSIKQIAFDEFKGPHYRQGEFSFTHNRWESGIRFNNFKIAAIARYDYVLDYSEDLAELVYTDKNKLEVDTNRDYELYLDVLHAHTSGVKLGYLTPLLPSLSMEVDISLLNMSAFMDGSLSGDVQISEDSYTGNIELDYVYDKDRLLERTAVAPDAYGYTLDLRWMFRPNEDLSIDAQILDLYSHIKINRAPTTSAQASSDRVNLDPSGRVDVKPVLTGREGYKEHTLRFPKRLSVEGRYRLSSMLEMGLGLHKYDSWMTSRLHVNGFISEHGALQTVYDFKTKAVTLGWKGESWHFTLTSDRFDITDAYTFGSLIGASFRF
ncbi:MULTISPECIES: hypothetical protein [unclassified Oleiphilus]|uniref:hypothetical protein n=2 Tax=Oleiphilus TaxID=141450 RepID=UPI0007C2F4C0|nr:MULTISPECIES: hypothetical protein [unclassified Oleiphilus]KZY48867.1 hypothetical protein A3732_05595 [Oleiphilus sp. HI0050]KZZ35712.1 hypothetical protein A3757_15100 [Oleiphilus sp. HI0117]KZZ38397.1 hypothetical protein A3756_10315 [Oleiphilus sp. HI0086]KZZ61528.1 hypothetical protein A3761_04135 [Oleiphilus sp. HI0123]